MSEAPLPGVRVSPAAPTSAFGVPEMVDLSGITGAVAQMAADEKRKADQLVELDTDNQLRTLQSDLVKRGLSRLGKDAMGATEEATTEWRKRIGEIEQGLKNDTQRATFRAHEKQRYDSMFSRLESHAFTEQRRYDEQETTTAIANRQADAVENYGDPAKVRQALDETRAIVADYAARNGLGPEARKAATEEAVSKAHMGVVNQMLADGKDLLAKDYLAEHREEINGTDLTRVDAAMREGSVRGESQRQAERIMGLGLSRADALAEARKIDDPDVQDDTVRRVNQRFQEIAAEQREASEAALTQAANIIDRTKSVDSVPPALWTTFTPGERSGLRSYARQLAKGEPVETDWQTYYDLKSLASVPGTRDAFIKTNLPALKGKLGDTEFKELTNLQAAMRKGDASADLKLVGLRTRNQIVSQMLTGAGIDPTPKKGTRDADRVAEFNRQVDERLAELQLQTGKSATPEDIQGVVDNLLVKGIVSGSGDGIFHFEKEKRAFELAPGETLDVTVDEVPSAERGMIEAALKRRGLPVTDDRIVQLYEQRLQQMTGAPQ